MLKIKQKQQLKKFKQQQRNMQKMAGKAQLDPHGQGAPFASLPYSPDCRFPQQSQQRRVHSGTR